MGRKFQNKRLLSEFFPILLLVIGSALSSFGQTGGIDLSKPPEKGIRFRAEVLDHDTLPVVDLESVDIIANALFRTYKQYEVWTRIKFNVKKVYPYAILASAKLHEYDKALESIHDPGLRKAFTKQCELDLRNQFEGELKSLTCSQGRLLMKLIDRETGRTTYAIVKEMRGGFQASMWQALARVFGHNMKIEYGKDPEDFLVERAIKVVEAGLF